MLFNSLHFIVFFPVVVLLYYATPHRFRWILLLISSYYFYMSWKAEYIVLIFASTLIDYYCGLAIHKSDSLQTRKYLLLISLFTNFGILFSFKYVNFFNSSINDLLNSYNVFYNLPIFQLLLPVGISFYTFQSVSYTIDIYRRRREPETHFGIFALYISFFPQLVAGPIERSSALLPQFYKIHHFNSALVSSGLLLMLWGFFKKLVIADRLAIFVDAVYGMPHDFTGWILILATYAFAFQVYCDFSGYSDIAIGAARVMGFRLTKNFRQPFLASSLSELWRRWHITLMNWFRDYVFKPLNRYWRGHGEYLSLLVVFAISGLWHGANWTFIIWGILHGSFLMIARLIRKLRRKYNKISIKKNKPFYIHGLQIIWTFHLFCFAVIFFRATDIRDAVFIIRHLLVNLDDLPKTFPGIKAYEAAIAVISVTLLMVVEMLQQRYALGQYFSSRPIWLRWTIYYSFIFGILILGEFGAREFIYFKF